MSRITEHPIVATVVGGLILSFLLSVLAWFGGVLSNIWKEIVEGAEYAWNAATHTVPVPAFIVVAVVLFVIVWVIRRVNSSQQDLKAQQVARVVAPAADGRLRAIANSLSAQETQILEVLVDLDGDPIVEDVCREILGASNLGSSQVLDSLENKQLIDVVRRHNYGEIALTNLGRDVMLSGHERRP